MGDQITDAAVLTLTGTATANSTVAVYDGATLLGSVTANGSGAWSYNTPTLANGTHSFTATDTVSGTTSSASPTLAVTVDTHTPTVPVISSDVVSSANVVTLNGSAEANSTVTVFDGTAQIGTATANTSGAWSFATAALPNGSHSFTATATDVAGATGAHSSALNLTLSTPVNLVVNGSFETDNFTGWTLGGQSQYIYIVNAAESGQFAAGMGPTGADGTLSQTLQTTAGQQYTLDFWLANAGSGPNDFTAKWNGQSLLALVNASAQGYTEYTYTVTATGNTSQLEFDFRQDPSEWHLDNISVTASGTLVPSAPAITAFSPDTGTVGDAITSANVLTLTGTAAANSTVNVYDGATLLGSATANASGAWTYTTAGLSNAIHSFTATDTVSGTTGVASAALNVTVDTVAPVAPTITAFSPDTGIVGDHITDAAVLTLTGTAEANSTVKVYDGATLLGSATANSSGAWSFTTGTLSNAIHSFTATATDVAGNTGVASSALSVTVDTVAPVAPSIASFSTDSGVVGDHITNDNTLTLTGSAEANSTVKVYDGATLLGSATANSSGAWTYTTAALSDGAHNLTTTATDAAGNTGVASSALSVTVDTVAPNAPVIASDAIINTNEVMLTGSAEANSTVSIYEATNLLGTATVNASGVWSYATSPLSDGPHTFSVTATDAAGNTSSASQSVDPIIGTAPTSSMPTDVITSDVKNSHGSFILSGTVFADGLAGTSDTVKVYDGTTYLGSTTVGSDGQWSFTTAALPNAVHTFTSSATDSLGKIGNSTGAAIYGTTGNNTLVGTAGNDLMTGGGGSDTFVFKGLTFGNDVITDFGTGSKSHDIIQLSNSAFNSFAAVLAHAAQVGSDVVISYDAADTITLKNQMLSHLTKSDFHIV